MFASTSASVDALSPFARLRREISGGQLAKPAGIGEEKARWLLTTVKIHVAFSRSAADEFMQVNKNH